jgi:hypothetical protein
MTEKEEILAVVNDCPANASFEAITEKLRVIAAVRRSRASVAAGKFKTHEQVEQIFERWAAEWQK